jgi:hypothetical protein
MYTIPLQHHYCYISLLILTQNHNTPALVGSLLLTAAAWWARRRLPPQTQNQTRCALPEYMPKPACW